MCNHTKLFLTLTLSFGLAIQGISQNLIKDYKKIADKSLINHFDTITLSQVECDRFTISDNDGSGRFFYETNKNKRIAFETITFLYSLFDKALNNDIYFYITINRQFKIIRDSSIVKNVPLCIRISQPCNFISSDSAKQISIADSIKYAAHLSSQLERNQFDKEFYWIIRGHAPAGRPKTNKPDLNLYAESISISQQRIINARTGQIISYKQFDYDW